MSGLQVNMTKGSILKSLLIFSLPILMSNLFQQLYNTMDILIVGNYLGDSSLAAIGASSSIYELLIGFCFGVGSGLLRDGDPAARDQSSRCSLHRMSGNGKEVKFLYDVTKHHHGCGNRNLHFPECRCRK